MKSFQTLSLLSILVVGSALSVEPPASRPAAKLLDEFTPDELIDRLTEITNQEFSLRTNIIAGDPLPQGLMRLHEPALAPVEAEHELIRRGVTVLPQLLNHLDDSRKTKATIKGMFGGITYSAEFDWNVRTGKPNPQGVVQDAFSDRDVKIVGAPQGNEYTVGVGDLCFNIIGEIVNRNYEALRYQPTAIVIVNSPLLCPALRDAVKAEWTGITRDRHRALLTEDVVRPDRPGRDEGGVEKLMTYYPDAAVDAVRQRLNVPLYDSLLVSDFAQKLYTIADAAARKQMIDGFVSANGVAFRDGLILQLWRDKFYQVGQKMWEPIAAPTVQAAPTDILASLIGKFDENSPPLVDSASFSDFTDFIEAIGTIPSPGIDLLIWDTFRKHDSAHSEKWTGDDRIAAASIKRLAHKGHDAELIAFCNRRKSELRATSEFSYGPSTAETLARFLILNLAPPSRGPFSVSDE